MMGGKSTSTTSPKLNGLQVQSSTLGLPLSLGWGRGRMKCNLIWYGAFTAIAHTTKTGGGKGLGGGSKNTTYTYTASIMMGICEGGASGIQGIRTIYKDTAVLTSLSAAGLSLATGTPTQPVWSYLTSKIPAQAIPYSGIAYVYAQDYDLADSATLSNHSFEIDFGLQLSGAPNGDADPKDIITDFLTNPAYGVPMWGSGLIGDLSDYSLYCRANNLLLSPVLESQSGAASIIEEWLTATNSAAFWSEGMIKIRPYGDAAATGNSATWTPNLTPAYDLTEDDLVVDDSGNAVSIEIVDQSDAYNIVQFEFLDRTQQYNVGIATAQDLDNIVTFGRRKQDPTTVHCICDPDIARKAVQLYGQRVLYTREKYTFKLPWNFALLEPTDLVTLTTTTDSLLLDRVLVRITEIAEDADDLLTVAAEGVPVGMASAALYASHSGSHGYKPNTEVAPGSVSAPWLFIAPPNLAGLDAEIWLAAASTSATWGGCQVWVSTDNSNYSMIGTIDGPARYGTLSASLAAGSDPDSANTLAVDLSISLGQLDSVSATDRDAGATLCMVGDEVVAFQTATLTSANRYNLTQLRRGQRGTTSGTHASGTNVARIDDAIFKFSYDVSNVGDTIYVKLPSFNIYGRGLQDLASATAYSIAISSAPGRAAYRDIKFMRAYAQPSTPTGDSPSGWYDGIPAGTATIWSSTALKTASGTLLGVWTAPQSLSGLTPRGDYDNSATYYLNNSVGYGGGSYVATQNGFSGHPPSGTAQANAYWDILAAPGDAGTPATPPGAFTATISVPSGSAVNLRTLADAAGYTGNSNATITFNVPSGVTVTGLASGGIGIDTGSWPTTSYTIALTLVVQNGGSVSGGGGNGGTGGGGGRSGGDAIYVRVPMTGGITINAGGAVRGGGGGGGSNAMASPYKIGTGGGGGGAPNGQGGAGSEGYITTGDDGQDYSAGGAGGSPGGGAGGGYATAGSASGQGVPGGAAGYAVRKNGNTVTVTNSGTMTGTAA
jgi:hypothetical protein